MCLGHIVDFSAPIIITTTIILSNLLFDFQISMDCEIIEFIHSCGHIYYDKYIFKLIHMYGIRSC
jgi:hypothetical protein